MDNSLVMEFELDLLKGRVGDPVGTEKIWNGTTYVKTSTGWKPKGKIKEAKQEEPSQPRISKIEEPSVPREKQLEDFADKAKTSQLEAAIKDPKQDKEVKKIAKEELEERKVNPAEDSGKKAKKKLTLKSLNKQILHAISLAKEEENFVHLISYVEGEILKLGYPKEEVSDFMDTIFPDREEQLRKFDERIKERESQSEKKEEGKKESFKKISEKIENGKGDVDEVIDLLESEEYIKQIKEIISSTKEGHIPISSALDSLKNTFKNLSDDSLSWFFKKVFPNSEELLRWENNANEYGPYSGSSSEEKGKMLKEGKSDEEIKQYFRQKAIAGNPDEKKYYEYHFLNERSPYIKKNKKELLNSLDEIAEKVFDDKEIAKIKKASSRNIRNSHRFLNPGDALDIVGTLTEALPVQYALASLDRELVCFPFMYKNYEGENYTSFDRSEFPDLKDYKVDTVRGNVRESKPVGKIAKRYAEAQPKASPEQLDAIYTYVGSSFSHFMTQYLYNDKDISKISESGWKNAEEAGCKTREQAVEKAEKSSSIINDYIDKNPIQENLVLSRRVDINANGSIFKQITGLKKGDIGKFDSFQSFSYIQISEFGSYQITLLAKKGDPIANANYVAEFEYLTKKDAQFKVLETGFNSMVIEFVSDEENIKKSLETDLNLKLFRNRNFLK